jgi:chromosome segregation ATPase
MSAVRQEAENFESLKAKVKDYDEIKKEMPSLILRLQQSEKLNNEYFEQKTLSDEIINKLRVDMQRLNDMFNSERRQHLEAKQTQIRQEQELNRVMREVDHLQKDANLIMDTKKTNQHLQLQNTLLQQRLDDEKANLQKSLRLMEKQHEEAEKVKSELSVHFWNLSEELKSTQQSLLVCKLMKGAFLKRGYIHFLL